MRRWVLILLSHLAWLLCGPLADASPLFDDNSLLEVELRGPLSTTLRDTELRAERPFVLTVDGVDLDVMARVRGKSRVATCKFPPLRLKFVQPGDTVFAGQDKLKLVTHCNKAGSFELNVLEEYAAYRIVALLAGSAMRVRLLRIRYIDTEKPRSNPLERFAIVLEPKRDLAQRINGELAELEGLSLRQLDREQIANVFVAQYLIGNADYSLVTAEGEEFCCHNGILVEVDGKLHYVPYDFDRALIVGARYARQQGTQGRRARSRTYVGHCMHDLDLESAIIRVRDARDEVFAELRAVEALSGRELDKAARFLEGFFSKAEDPARLSASFEKRCVGR